MCGIVGIASAFKTVRSVSHRWLSLASLSLIHRGPDDFGDWWDSEGYVGFAHRRLSIMDLSAMGHQPMTFEDRGLTITFNGEIYNFVDLRNQLSKLGYFFHSSSDTEVLLSAYAEWGEDCLQRIEGMFAFAIWDRNNKSIFLARDRAGEKPLFYSIVDGVLYFASELKALLCNSHLSRNINPKALDCYLSSGYVPGKHCILDGYNKLPPAHAMTFSLLNAEAKIWRYWSIPEFTNESDDKNLRYQVGKLEILLDQAVERQMSADVPVGVLLSGGIDSSLITAMAARHSKDVFTFTMAFSGYGDYDESAHADLISRHFCTKHIKLEAEPSLANLLPTLANQFDEPMADSSMLPAWMITHLVKKYCTVALGGDGGDELFGGYHMHQRLLWMKKNVGFLPNSIKSSLSALAENYMPSGAKGRNFLVNLGYDLTHEIPHFQQLFDKSSRLKLMPMLGDSIGCAEVIRRGYQVQRGDLLYRATHLDFESYLAEDILVKVDRTSMLNSLEMRAPFLDHRLVEFAFGSIPSSLKASENNKKILLKELATKVLPPQFDKKRKQGFAIPMKDWLKSGPLRELFWDTLTSAECVFSPAAIQDLLKGQDNGLNNGERLFSLVIFELWRKNFNIRL